MRYLKGASTFHRPNLRRYVKSFALDVQVPHSGGMIQLGIVQRLLR
jgi:hypothetical protein